MNIISTQNHTNNNKTYLKSLQRHTFNIETLSIGCNQLVNIPNTFPNTLLYRYISTSFLRPVNNNYITASSVILDFYHSNNKTNFIPKLLQRHYTLQTLQTLSNAVFFLVLLNCHFNFCRLRSLPVLGKQPYNPFLQDLLDKIADRYVLGRAWN